jgi:hypothetical protein
MRFLAFFGLLILTGCTSIQSLPEQKLPGGRTYHCIITRSTSPFSVNALVADRFVHNPKTDTLEYQKGDIVSSDSKLKPSDLPILPIPF